MSAKSKRTTLFAVALMWLTSASCPMSAQQAKKPFSVADAIKAVHLDNNDIRLSPDGKYVVIHYERGRLELNRVEESLRFYRIYDPEYFVTHPEVKRMPAPIWVLTQTAKEGPVIRNWRWLGDSSGVIFVAPSSRINNRLMLANIRAKTIEPLTPEVQSVRMFDVRDRSHYVYTVDGLTELDNRRAEEQKPAIVGTGRSLTDLIFWRTPGLARRMLNHRKLWAVDGGQPFEVGRGGSQFAHLGDGSATLALSHDGKRVVTLLLVPRVPSSWMTQYPPSWAVVRGVGGGPVKQYVMIDLPSGSVRSLTQAPIADWWDQDPGAGPRWSDDDRQIYLANTFIKSKDNATTPPCAAAIVNLATNEVTCAQGSGRQSETRVTQNMHGDLVVAVEEGLNVPPLLVARTKHISRILWDPNPQFENVELGQATVYTWTDKNARVWKGGLYRPADYEAGRRYPLVIQTHGFGESQFSATGSGPTGYAARALAATGIVVLQVPDGPDAADVQDKQNCSFASTDGLLCLAGGYQAAVNQIVSEGIVDPEKVGIMGFSATCSSLMVTLTATSLHVSAAILNDGSTHGYLHHLLTEPDGAEAAELDVTYGARPVGEGLQQWVTDAPDFNLDKVHAPVLIVAASDPSRLLKWLWESYAGLRYLHKPVDLAILNSDQHNVTNPAVQLASEGGAVDWFRFWLQNYEDPDPAKAGQYERWRGLKKMQEESQSKESQQGSRAGPRGR